MSSFTTQSIQVTQVFGNVSTNRIQQEVPHPSGPKIIEMDLDTVESVSNLDHTHQKGRSELAQRGSLSQRRPPTRAGIRAYAKSVWEQEQEEGYSTVSSEEGLIQTNSDYMNSNEQRDEPEGKEDETEHRDISEEEEEPTRGWKRPPKHAVLVFPLQLLNSNKFKETETVIQESENIHRKIVVEEPRSTSESSLTNANISSTTTVRITQESESDCICSSSDEDVLQKSKAEKRLSAPTIVSITLKDPKQVKSSRSVENLTHEEKPNPMIITIGEHPPRYQRSNSCLASMDSTFSVLKEKDTYTNEDLLAKRLEEEEEFRRNMGVQVRIKNRRAPSPPKEATNPKQNYSTELNSPLSKHHNFFNISDGTSQFANNHSLPSQQGNTVVFIKPTISESPRSDSSRSPDIHASKMKWGKENESKENLYGIQEKVPSHLPNFRNRELSGSSIDRHSVTSRGSSKDDSPERSSPSPRKSDRHQRVQIQTWDRRAQEVKSPSPSRSKIRELVMSRGSSVSPLRPTIGEDFRESDRTERRKEVKDETPSLSSCRSSPTGLRYFGRPTLSERENKPEWLAKIDFNRRKDIDWDNLASTALAKLGHLQNGGNMPRKTCSEPRSTSPSRYDKFNERQDRSSDILDRSALRLSEEFSTGRAWERSHSDSYLLEEDEPKEPQSRNSLFLRNTETPEWVRIAEQRRRSSINWEEIAASRKADLQKKLETEEDPTFESHNVGVQVNFRRPDSKNKPEGKERRSTSPNRKTVSKIPRSSGQEELKEETNVVQNILSKVRSSQETNRDSKESKNRNWPRSPSPWRSDGKQPLYRFPEPEKEVVIEELPRVSSRGDRMRSPSPIGGQQERTARLREGREQKKERPRSAIELGSQPSKRRPSPGRPPSPRSSEPPWKVPLRSSSNSRPPTMRRQPSPEPQTNPRTHSVRNKAGELRRRSSSYDRLSSMSSGSEAEERHSDVTGSAKQKKVRFLINRGEKGVELQRPQLGTTYTMFGMERACPTAASVSKTETPVIHEIEVEHRDSLNGSNSPTPKTQYEPSALLNEDDYQLQAYKIINHIKQMSKGSSTVSNSSVTKPATRTSRESSPNRMEQRRGSSSPNLERGANTESNKPVWAELKLKKTPYSTRFLVRSSLEMDSTEYANGFYGEYDCDGVVPYEEEPSNRVEEFGDNEEVSLVAEKLRINECALPPLEDSGGDSSPMNGYKSIPNGSSSCETTTKRPEMAPCVQDSEGYSSMDSCFSSRLISSSCKHCGRKQEDINSLNSSSSSVSQEMREIRTVTVSHKLDAGCCTENGDDGSRRHEEFKTHHDQETVSLNEPTLPPPPPLSVSLSLDSDLPQQYSNNLYQSMDQESYSHRLYQAPNPPRPYAEHMYHSVDHVSDELTSPETDIHRTSRDSSESKARSRTNRSVSMRVVPNQELSLEDKSKGKPIGTTRRNSLSETRQKLLDILTSKTSKRGPQIKTIRKTIRRILRGAEMADEEEEIVEEITEEVFGMPDKCSKSSESKKVKGQQSGITRTVHQDRDGRRYLTTTVVDSMDEPQDSAKVPIRVSAKRIT